VGLAQDTGQVSLLLRLLVVDRRAKLLELDNSLVVRA